MFKSYSNKGFRITFANGYALSVQWGPMNYCTNRGTNTNWDIAMSVKDGVYESETAEVAVYNPDNKRINLTHNNTVYGNVYADDIVDLIALVSEGNESSIEVYFKRVEFLRSIEDAAYAAYPSED